MALIDMVGQRFDRLIVVARAENDAKGTARWLCKCDCGGEAVSHGSNLRRGSARSCGCRQREIARSHAARMGVGMRRHGHAVAATREYQTWGGMKQRCENPNCRQYPNYGGRGIRVCERWKTFENFLSDMGSKPAEMSIERIDVNGDYEPSNCRWATVLEQNNNTRANRVVDFRGQRLTVSQACRAAGVNRKTVSTRLHRGWAIERALA